MEKFVAELYFSLYIQSTQEDFEKHNIYLSIFHLTLAMLSFKKKRMTCHPKLDPTQFLNPISTQKIPH